LGQQLGDFSQRLLAQHFQPKWLKAPPFGVIRQYKKIVMPQTSWIRRGHRCEHRLIKKGQERGKLGSAPHRLRQLPQHILGKKIADRALIA